MLKTRLTDLLGIRHPIISAPMVRYSGGHLASAVSAAGGLGTVGGVSPVRAVGPEYIREQVGYIRSQTDEPFGVGFITQYISKSPQNFEAALEEKVPVILFSFADPQPWLSRAKESGAKTVCQVQTMEGARLAVDAGADVLAAQGNEAGGHTGTMNLLPFLVRVIEEFPDVPVIAAGGIASGRSLAAVLVAGAEGAWVGTPFLATQENNEVPDIHKERVVQSDGENTVYTKVYDIIRNKVQGSFWPEGIAARLHMNRFIQEWHGREDELRARLDEIVPVWEAAIRRGDRDIVPMLFGQGAAFVHAVRPAAEVLRGICEEAELFLRQRAVDLIR